LAAIAAEWFQVDVQAAFVTVFEDPVFEGLVFED
jgi:hypothetical protein